MFSDSLKVIGDLHIELTDIDGKLKDVRDVKNLVVQTGKVFIADRMLGDTTIPVMSHMSVGTDSVTPVSTDLGLNSEIARVTIISTVRVDNVVTYTATFPAGTGTGPLTEAGIFNDPTAGSMLSRTVFAVVNKGVSDTLTIVWNITIQ